VAQEASPLGRCPALPERRRHAAQRVHARAPISPQGLRAHNTKGGAEGHARGGRGRLGRERVMHERPAAMTRHGEYPSPVPAPGQREDRVHGGEARAEQQDILALGHRAQPRRPPRGLQPGSPEPLDLPTRRRWSRTLSGGEHHGLCVPASAGVVHRAPAARHALEVHRAAPRVLQLDAGGRRGLHAGKPLPEVGAEQCARDEAASPRGMPGGLEPREEVAGFLGNGAHPADEDVDQVRVVPGAVGHPVPEAR